MATTDRRRRYDDGFKRTLLRRARERHWSMLRLARESGISRPTLYRWRQQFEAEPRASKVGFVDVTEMLAPNEQRQPAAPPLEVVLRSGHRLLVGTGVEAAVLRQVVAALESPC